MESRQRYLSELIQEDAFASNKIAFVSGPRQVGKTTMAQSILESRQQLSNYFSYDDDEFRKVWISGAKGLLASINPKETLVFDEIHKDRQWKNKLKGLYDLFGKSLSFLVTSSARLDFYRKSGDSLQGRYFPYRMHPLSAGESPRIKAPPTKEWDENYAYAYDWQDLLALSGFPEPFFGQSQAKAQRWQRLYRERMIREDLRDLQEVRDVQTLENLALLLQDRSASQLSYEALRQDLSSSFDSIKRWIDLLETLYYCYRLTPYSKNVRNSLRKEPKLFLYDWALAQSPGARFENMIASHLLKSCHAWTDAAMGEFSLHYVRDKQKREVDFLITQNNKPYALIEVKSGARTPTPSLLYFQKQLNPKFCLQVVKEHKNEKAKIMDAPGVQIISAKRFLGGLV